MKHYTKLFFAAAVAALGLASCAKEVAPVETPKDNLVTVHFGATAGIEGATKATLTTEDELTFTSAWENKDALSVKYSFDYGTPKETTATWSSDKSCFEAQIGGAMAFGFMMLFILHQKRFLSAVNEHRMVTIIIASMI